MAKLLHTLMNLQHPTVPLFALAKGQRSKRQLSKSFELVSQPLSTRLIKTNFRFVHRTIALLSNGSEGNGNEVLALPTFVLICIYNGQSLRDEVQWFISPWS